MDARADAGGVVHGRSPGSGERARGVRSLRSARARPRPNPARTRGGVDSQRRCGGQDRGVRAPAEPDGGSARSAASSSRRAALRSAWAALRISRVLTEGSEGRPGSAVHATQNGSLESAASALERAGAGAPRIRRFTMRTSTGHGCAEGGTTGIARRPRGFAPTGPRATPRGADRRRPVHDGAGCGAGSERIRGTGR